MKYISVILVAVGVAGSLTSAQQYYSQQDYYPQQDYSQQYNYPQQDYAQQNYQQQSYPQQNYYSQQDYSQQNYPQQSYSQQNYYPQQSYSQVGPIASFFANLINKLTNNVVVTLVTKIVFNLVAEINSGVDANSPVAVAVLKLAVKALQDPSVGALLTALYLLMGGNKDVLENLPGGLKEIHLDGDNFLNYLISQIGPDTSSLPFFDLSKILGNYLVQLFLQLISQ